MKQSKCSAYAARHCWQFSQSQDHVHFKAKLPNLYFSLSTGDTGASAYTEYQNNILRHYMFLGGAGGEDGWSIGENIWTIDAYRIDAKLDDGMPRSGLVTPVMIGGNECHDSVTPVNAYDVVNPGGCALAITAGF